MAQQNNQMQVGWFKGGDKIIITQNKVECKGNESPYNTVYGSQIASKGINVWKIKIIQKKVNMFIGIASTTNHCNGIFMGNYKDKDPFNVAYGSVGNKVSNKSAYESYGDEYEAGDIITVSLNMNSLNISFSKNDKELGIAFSNIQKTDYRLAVCLFGSRDGVEMISYVNK